MDMMDPRFWEYVMRLVIAGFLGGVIGIERAYRAKEAGLRTHFLVALGSALLMMVSQHGFVDMVADGIRYDPARIAAQIVSGIGFIGAGTIIFQKQIVRGLTTAAGLWTAAGIGMAVGGGLYFLALAATILALIGFETMKWLCHFLHISTQTVEVRFATSVELPLPVMLSNVDKFSCRILSYSANEDASTRHVVMLLRFRDTSEINSELISKLNSIPEMHLESIE